MPDVLADGRFGRDDGIKCDECGSKTFLVDDQGGGLMSYECEECELVFLVQYEHEDDEEYEAEGWEEAMFDERGSPV
jgi:DNA-directed RNA polymerase subunit RPC12/RpoP